MATTYFEQASQAPPSVQLEHMLVGSWISEAIGVVAELGIADLLVDGPQSVAKLAEQTGSHQRSLYRLLRALASVGVFSEVDPERFGLTPLAEPLRADAPRSLRDRIRFSSSEVQRRVWSQLRSSVRTGQTGFEHLFGMGAWEYRAQHPEANSAFNAAMTSNSSRIASAVAEAYDFSQFSTLVDVGGGRGMLLTSILTAHPTVNGILFDQPHVVHDAGSIMQAADVADRCEIVGGDFLKCLPSGALAYLLKSIIHDWDDEQAITILTNCRRAMGQRGTLLLVEQVLQDGDDFSFSKLTDLNMLVSPGGQERTEAEYRSLLATAGFNLSRVIPTGTAYSIVEGLPIRGTH